MSEKKVTLSRSDLTKTWFSWICFSNTCYNYERMMGLGFCNTMLPVLKKLYGNDKSKLSEALTRHLTFYNTESNWGAMIPGIVSSLEEEKANGGVIEGETISNLKTALMGPLAGIGDSITQGLVKVILLGIGIDLALKGSALGPILFVVAFSAYALITSYICFFSGYKLGKNAVVNIMSGGVKEISEALGAMSMMVLGGFVANNIGITTPLIFKFGQLSIKTQDILNTILPKMLPLSLFLVIYVLIRKGVKPVNAMLIIFGLGIVLSYFKILG